jgi:hypothetical protein
MKRALSLLFILSVAFSTRTFAGLGNSENEIVGLYGKSIDPGSPDSDGTITNTYQKGDYLILVQFAKGSCVAESYTRKDRRKFSDKEITAILSSNAGGKEWKRQLGAGQNWERTDHAAHAWTETLTGRPTLLIQAKSGS